MTKLPTPTTPGLSARVRAKGHAKALRSKGGVALHAEAALTAEFLDQLFGFDTRKRPAKGADTAARASAAKPRK